MPEHRVNGTMSQCGPTAHVRCCARDGGPLRREVARQDKRKRFTTLLHHVTVALLKSSLLALKREASPGVDGVTWQAYATDLDARLEELHDRVHRGTYRAQPSKRAYIAK